LDISEARKQFNTLDKRLKDERVLYVTRHGNQAFAVVDIEYLSALKETIEILSDPEAMEMLRKSIDDVREGRLHDHDDVQDELL
jgi:PHD/YefM family antitoxin component YafN of YafNO toxin-antitoxin module